jgi:hypothetical protein
MLRDKLALLGAVPFFAPLLQPPRFLPLAAEEVGNEKGKRYVKPPDGLANVDTASNPQFRAKRLNNNSELCR